MLGGHGSVPMIQQHEAHSGPPPSFWRRLWPRSIRSRVLLVALAAIAIITVVPIVDEIRERDKAEEEGRDSIARASRLAAQAENQRYEYVRELLVLAAQYSRVTNAIENRQALAIIDCQLALEGVSRELPDTAGLRLSEADGSYICANAEPAPASQNISDRLFFREAIERDGFAVGQFEEGRVGGRPVLGFALPLRDAGGQVNAVLSTGLWLDTADPLVVEENVPPESMISLLDYNGTVLRSTSLTPGDRFDQFDDISDAGREPRLITIDGEVHAVTRVTPLGQTGVYALVSIPEGALAPPLYEDLLPNLLVILAVALIASLVLWVLIDRLLGRPVQRLTAASEQLTAGELSARVDVRDGTELQQLADTFNTMASELETRTGALQEAIAAKDEFLGLVSHELRTPITVVMGNARALQRRGDTLDEQTRREALEDIVSEGERLNRIITNLLVLARIERGQEPEIEPVHLSRTAARCALGMESRFLREITIDPLHDDAWVLGEPGYLEQVITNLVSNAAKYSPRGEPIVLSIDRLGDQWALSVADRGPGVQEHERERIFETFYRSGTTADSSPGVGIGLSVCARLVTALGGRIWVEPREGGGSVFRFTVPAYDLEEEPAADRISEAPVIAGTGEADGVSVRPAVVHD